MLESNLCRNEGFSCTYLGLPLHIRKPSASQLQELTDKVGNKLQGWRAPMLSLGGRLTLVKSTLCVVPVYAMLSLDLPVKTIQALKRSVEVFSGKGGKTFEGETVWFHGGRFACPTASAD